MATKTPWPDADPIDIIIRDKLIDFTNSIAEKAGLYRIWKELERMATAFEAATKVGGGAEAYTEAYWGIAKGLDIEKVDPITPEDAIRHVDAQDENVEYGTQDKPYQIYIPGWDDIIKINPRVIWWKNAEISKRDWAIYFSMRKKGRLDRMKDQDKRQELDRRVAKYDALRASPTPELVKAIGQLMTFLDDTEDLLSTTLVIGRALIKKLPWLAAKLGARFLPGLGWILTITSLLEIGSIIWTMISCGKKGKKQGFDILDPINWTRKGRIKMASEFMKKKPGVGALIEGLQATEMLFGTGLQLGSAIGLATDSVSGPIVAAGGKTVKITNFRKNQNVFTRKIPGLLGEETMKKINSVTNGEYERIAIGMDSAAKIMAAPIEGWQEVHEKALVAFALGMQVLQPYFADEEMIRRSDKAMGWEIPLKTPWEPMTRTMMEADGINPDRDEPHFFSGSPSTLTYGQLAERQQKGARDIIEIYRGKFPRGEEAVFISSTMQEIGLWAWNTDIPPKEWEKYEAEFELTPVERAFLRSFEF